MTHLIVPTGAVEFSVMIKTTSKAPEVANGRSKVVGALDIPV